MKANSPNKPARNLSLKPKQVYFGLIILLAVLLVGGLISFSSLQKQLGKKIANLTRVDSDIVLENQQIGKLQQLQTDYQQVQPLADQVQAVLPPQKNQAEVVAQIATIVQGRGLVLSGLTFDTTQGLPSDQSQTQPAIGVSGIFVMPVKFETTGSYNKIEALLKSFELEQHFMRVSVLEITRTDSGQLDANFTLEVFFKP